jgi:hypothetical protein
MSIVRIPRLTPRAVLAFVMGIAAIFDLTGATVYRTMREVLPPAPAPEDGSDPFRAAMRTIMTSYHDAMEAADDRAAAPAGREHAGPEHAGREHAGQGHGAPEHGGPGAVPAGPVAAGGPERAAVLPG